MASPVAIVTGASRGIGQATAVALAKAGYAVVIAARDQEGLARTATLAGHNAVIRTIPADVSQKGDVDNVIARTDQEFGRIDLLVNNAGVAPLAPIDELSEDDFKSTIAVNVEAVFHATKAAWPIFKRQASGTIISISSFASVDPFPGFQAYGASKAWVNLFTKAIADEGRPLGIRAFSLAVGTVETALLRGLFPDYPPEQTLPPEEVASLLVTLAEPACRYASGSTIFVRK